MGIERRTSMGIENIKIKIKLYDGAKLPERQHHNDACYDICCNEDVTLQPNEMWKIETGIAFEIPDDYYMQIFSRSGLSTEGIILLNSVGIIDAGYRGTIKIPVMNLSKHGFAFNKGDRIAQISLRKRTEINFDIVDELSSSDRSINGFGSTGI